VGGNCGAAGKLYRGHEWLIVPLCFAVIYLVPLVYTRIGGAVIKELRKNETVTAGSSAR
jgi:hypothetical protein